MFACNRSSGGWTLPDISDTSFCDPRESLGRPPPPQETLQDQQEELTQMNTPRYVRHQLLWPQREPQLPPTPLPQETLQGQQYMEIVPIPKINNLFLKWVKQKQSQRTS